MRVFKVVTPILALAGVPLSIWDIGVYGDVEGMLFCWFCLTILFWWYLANVVFTTSKKERRNTAFKKVVGREKAANKDGNFKW